MPGQGARVFIEEKKPFIIDIRTPPEFKKGRIRGSVNIPLNNLSSSSHLIPKDRIIFIYCRTVNRSRAGLKILTGAGFTSVYALDGGFKALEESGSSLIER